MFKKLFGKDKGDEERTEEKKDEKAEQPEEDIKDMVISEIPADEKILKEGVSEAVLLRQRFSNTTPYKYAITEKGIWVRNKKSRFVQSKTVFVPFDDIKNFETIVQFRRDCCVLYPKKGLVQSGTYFDDHEGAVAILSQYLERLVR